jgi:hypothetical protein
VAFSTFPPMEAAAAVAWGAIGYTVVSFW